MTGLQEVDGKYYYFNPITGEMKTGKQSIGQRKRISLMRLLGPG